eukprot:gene7344-14991_t
MLPQISSKRSSDSLPDLTFQICMESIQDLFYDQMTDPNEELIKLQVVLDIPENKIYLNSIYSKGLLNRKFFQKFARNTCDIDNDVADEIFSCAADAFTRDESKSGLIDVNMSPAQFAASVVRLANLWIMMNEGMADASKLAYQTSTFLMNVRST